jgi:hypothetical protein
MEGLPEKKEIGLTENVTERLLDVEVTEGGALVEEIELICCRSDFRRRSLFHHLGEGFFRFAELEPS